MFGERCNWCGEGFEYNEPRVEREGKMVFHLVSKKGKKCVEEYRKELRRIIQEEDRRRDAFKEMG